MMYKYKFKFNTFNNICTEKNSYTNKKYTNFKIFFCFFNEKT